MSENQRPDQDRSATPEPAPPRPLDYARAGRQQIALPMICGMILGVAGILVVGFAGSLLAEQLNNRPWALHSMLLAIVFFIPGALMLIVVIRNISRMTRGWFLIGLLLGAGVMSLMEGLCFLGS